MVSGAPGRWRRALAPRWVTHLCVGPDGAGADLGDAYAAAARAWWADIGDGRRFEDVFYVLPRAWRHITVAPVDLPAEQVSPVQIEQLAEVISARLAGASPVDVTLGPPLVHTVAVELYVAPSAAPRTLHGHVVGAIRDGCRLR